jgi:hypothetical protein
MMRRYSGPRHLMAGCVTPRRPSAMKFSGLTTISCAETVSIPTDFGIGIRRGWGNCSWRRVYTDADDTYEDDEKVAVLRIMVMSIRMDVPDDATRASMHLASPLSYRSVIRTRWVLAGCSTLCSQ